MNLGIIFAEKIGDFDEAIEQYKKVINTKRRGVHIPLVYNSGKSIKMNKAIAYYNMGHAYRQKAIYLPKEEYTQYREYLKKSAEAYENAIDIYKNDYDTSYNLALVYQLLKDYNNKTTAALTAAVLLYNCCLSSFSLLEIRFIYIL